jgi:hypothetical protein
VSDPSGKEAVMAARATAGMALAGEELRAARRVAAWGVQEATERLRSAHDVDARGVLVVVRARAELLSALGEPEEAEAYLASDEIFELAGLAQAGQGQAHAALARAGGAAPARRHEDLAGDARRVLTALM